MSRRESAVRAGVCAAVIAAIVCGIFAWLGVVNGDEGWYVLAARFVGAGRLPYRDFAFTQGPVYPYLLAPFVRLVPGLYTARAVSVACTAVSIGLLIAVARRTAGKMGAIVAGLALLATIPSLPYWLSITKTYSLSCLFLSAILFTLTSSIRRSVRYPLAAALAVAFAETRSTGVALAALLIIALLILSPNARLRVRVIAVSVVVLLPFSFLVFLDWTRAKWGLLDYHQLGSTGDSGILRFTSRSFDAARAWPGPFLLGAAALVVVLADSDMRAFLKRRLDLTAYALGIAIFVLLHEASGAFFAEEYLAPVIAPLVVVSVVILVRAASKVGRERSALGVKIVAGVLAVGIVATAVTGGHSDYLGAPGWSGDPAGMSAITRCVKKNSKPHDVVFALSLEEAVVQADRQPAPNVSLGMFSYQDVTTKRARQLKILNDAALGLLFARKPPKILVLMVDDIFETKRTGYFSHHRADNLPFYVAFKKYRVACRDTIVRNTLKNVPEDVTVYVRP